MRYIFVFVFTLFAIHVTAQQNNVWVFGNNAGIDWNSGSPVAITTSMTSDEGVASVADTAGNLLFYTNGLNVWDKNFQIMPNGDDLGGMASSTSVMIMQTPSKCSRFYIFTTEDHTSTDNNMYYSVVDMDLNGGLGDVMSGQKKILMHDNVSEKLAMVPQSNGSDYWLISHELGNNTFVVFSITASGINMTPQLYNIGSTLPSNAETGQLKANADGTILAMASLWSNFLQVVNFDPSTGIVSCSCTNHGPAITSDVNGLYYGVEFSANGEYLYVTRSGYAGSDAGVYQVNLTTGAGIELFAAVPPVNYYYGALQMGEDGKIYVSRNTIDTLGVINAPDNNGLAANYVDDGFALAPGTYAKSGLPGPVNINLACYPSGVTTIKEDALVVYPNPAENVLVIELGRIHPRGVLTVSNMIGKKLLTQALTESQRSIDVSQLSSGLYVLEFEHNGQRAIGKFVKQ